MRPEILNPLFCSIGTLKGVGARYLKLLSNLAEGDKIVHLLWHLPYNVVDRTYSCPLRNAQSGKIWTGIVRISAHLEPKSKKQPYRVVCGDATGDMILNFFKYYKDSLKKQLPIGAEKLISGKIQWFNGQIQMSHPDYVADPSFENTIKAVEPIYPLCAGVSNKMMISLARQALSKIPDMPEWLDERFLQEKNWPSFKEALYFLHHPQSTADFSMMSPQRLRLAYDELLANQLTLSIARLHHKKEAGRSIEGNGHLRKKLSDSLGFELTGAQKKVLEDIIKDQKSKYQGLRLVQGDVGCGKTVVAMMAMLNAVEAGFQAAIMAPTEILAKQHMETISAWADIVGIKAGLLTSKIKGKKRAEILEKLKNGEIDILIGTHALFTDEVIFKDLAFIVVDEQHRFGVEQRRKLSLKGNKPDIVVMTATPIPRTIVLTRFGDMDYSKIDELPKGRKPVETAVMPLSKIDSVTEAVMRKIKGGARVYWVCPLIEESEKSDLAAAIKRFEDLQKIFGADVGLVHGKMKESEKDAVMEKFKTGEIKILVATTVIEVGVNVKEATLMVIEQAERFGLAQLHQLRGRIKRGFEAGFCVLLYAQNLSETAYERLKTMKESEDGFFLAEKDLDLRGGGEILGTKQSGFEEFKIADLAFHKNLLLTAHKDAEMILNLDSSLQSQRGQALKNLLYLFEQDEAFLTYKA
ncbi:MAG: ATP-dependent DNA helicase RecG [Alphaproteobacteria bacterium]|nr:ATP-dependent DNA helicase RecG [Alphaproteobacteria bacterium]